MAVVAGPYVDHALVRAVPEDVGVAAFDAGDDVRCDSGEVLSIARSFAMSVSYAGPTQAWY